MLNISRKCARRTLMICSLTLLIGQSPGAYALDAASVQEYCNQLKQAAIDAQTKYVKLYQPRQDPGKTFDNAVRSCLGFISNITVGIPTSWDAILKALAQQIMQRICQAAQDEFNSAVNEAMQEVNQTTNDINQVPGVNVGVSNSTTGGSVGVNTSTTSTDAGSTASSIFNRK